MPQRNELVDRVRDSTRRTPPGKGTIEAWSRAKDIFNDALGVARDERVAFVRERCGDDAGLCDEVMSLLAWHATQTNIADASASDDAEPLADIVPGAKIAGYTVIDRIGRGGMGQVLLARDAELRRWVALKCLLTSARDAGVERARILNEARAAAAVTHANIAAVYHVVEQDDRAYIVMEYVSGETLADILHRERLPIDRVIAIGRQLTAALKAAHGHGVVHRDIKPGNIQVTFDGIVKVLDFGVARAAPTMRTASPSASTADPRASASSPALTRLFAGGTPPYMSPEQLLGEAVDARSDLFSLGVVLFEMATGRRPFAGATADDILDVQQSDPPRADTIDPHVPPALADALAKALSRNPADRFSSAAEFDAALAAIQVEQPRTANARQMLARWAWRLAVAAIVAAAVFGALGFVVVYTFNTTFGRTDAYEAFGSETIAGYIGWGLRSLVPPLIYVTATAIAAYALRTVILMAGRFPRLAPTIERGRARFAAWREAFGLDDPDMLAQTLTAAGVLSIAAVLWRFRRVVLAAISSIDTAPAAVLAPLAPGFADRALYRFTLDVLILVFGIGLLRVLRLRRQRKLRPFSPTVAALGVVVVVMVVLTEAPYRTFFLPMGERIRFDDRRCYIIGEHANEWLIHCPDVPPPRNRVISRNDPRVEKGGAKVIESVFSEPKPPAAGR